MAVAALITLLVTAGGGFILLGRWVSRGGHRPGSGTRLVPGLVFGHFALAAISLVLWIVFLATDNGSLAWVTFVLLLVVALLGFTMLARWLGVVRGGAGAPESALPVPVVVAHGLFAATSLVLVLLTAVSQ